jgi:hypothetical protein
VGSVKQAYAILRGRLTGDQQGASDFLDSLSDNERKIRNNKETRVQTKMRKRGYHMGIRR